MLQRGNSDAAKRVRDARKPVSAKRERVQQPSDPAQLHEQAVAAAVLAHEMAYGVVRSSMEDDKTPRSARPSLERQRSHIARHLSNASNKSAARPRNVRKSASAARVDKMAMATPRTTSSLTSSKPNAFPSARSSPYPFRSVHSASEQEADHTVASLPSRPASNISRQQSSYITPRSDESGPAISGVYDDQDVANNPWRYASHGQEMDDVYGSSPAMQTNVVTTLLTQQTSVQDFQERQNLRSASSARSLPFLSRRNKSDHDQSGENAVAAFSKPIEVASESDQATSYAGKTLSKPRRISVNITNTIKRAFRRRNITPTPEIPPQQVQAARPHYGSESTTASRRLSMSTTGADTDNYAAAPLNPPVAPFAHDYESYTYQQPIGTVSSTDTYYTKSRVTSWMTNSTDAHTMKLQHLTSHLPSIQESPQRRVSYAGSVRPMTEHDVHDEARETDGRATPRHVSRNTSSGKIDSKRLLSALRNHINGTNIHQHHGSETRNASGSTAVSWQPTEGTSARNKKTAATSTEDKVEMSTRIRDFNPSDLPHDPSYVPSSELVAEVQDTHEGMMSPSIYSFRPGVNERQPQDSAITLPRRSASPGVAMISESHQVSVWSRSAQNSPSKSPNTSGEWRSWAADELADLEYAVTAPANAPKYKRNNPFSRMAERRASAHLTESAKAAETDAAVDFDIFPVPPSRPKLAQTSYESMNERFPMLQTGNKVKSSPVLSRKTSSSKASTYDMSKDCEPNLKARSSSANLRADHALPRKRSNLALHVMNTDDVADLPKLSHLPEHRSLRQRENEPRPKNQSALSEQPSLAHLVEEERSRQAGSPRRHARVPGPIDDNFILRIRRGPYGTQSSSSPEKADSSVESLDLLSRRNRPRNGGMRQTANTGNENNRPSPTKGQSMVDEFLGKRMRRARVQDADDVDEGHGSSPRFL